MALANTKRRVSITTQPNLIPSSQTAFPVLITRANLPDEMFDPNGSNSAQSDGGDIRIASDKEGNLPLPIELVGFSLDSTSAARDGFCEIWCKTNLDATSSIELWIFYSSTTGTESQPAVTDSIGRNAVYDSKYSLVLHFGEDSGNTVLDSTGNGNDGTINGASRGSFPDSSTLTFKGKPVTTLYFDGDDDYVDCGNVSVINTLTAITVEFWVVPTSGGGDWGGYVAKGTGFSAYDGFNFRRYGSDNSRIQFHGLGSNQGPIATLSVDNWNHVAGVWDGSTRDLYINGVLQDSVTDNSSTIDSGTNPLRFGARAGDVNRNQSGKLSDIRIWNYAKTQTEIQNNMNTRLNGDETGIIAYYKLNEGTGTTAIDSAGTNDGSLINGPKYVVPPYPSKHLSFDGIDDYVSFGSSSYTVKTLEFWANVGEISNNNFSGTPISFSSNQDEIVFGESSNFVDNETIMGQYKTSSGNYERTAITKTFEPGWHHICFVWDNNINEYKISVDGSFYPTTHSSEGVLSLRTTSQIDLGYDGNGGKYLDGKLSEVRIYDVPITENELSIEYNNQIDPTNFWTTSSPENVLQPPDQLSIDTVNDNSVRASGLFNPDNNPQTIHWIISKFDTTPTLNQIKNGQNFTGDSAKDSGSEDIP